MRKTRALILSLIMVLATMTSYSYAQFSDVPENAAYIDAINRLSVLGIMNGAADNLFKPDDMLTREQFAKIIVVASGLESDAAALKGTTVFPDISYNAWSSGYINEALNNGFITGMPDGKFHPGDKVTFAQACTVLVKALGYTDQELQGYWPNNYIEKAKLLGLTDGVSIGKNDGLPRWAAAVMIDALLSTNIKKANPTDTDKVFAEVSGLYTPCIVLGDSRTSDKLLDNQVLTDKGIFYIPDGLKNLELGNRYEFSIKDDRIINAYNKLETLVKITVESAADTKIMYKDETGKENTMVLPDKTVYYYNGEKQPYENLKDLLQANTSIAFADNGNKDGYDYAVIFDQVYSKPEIGYELDLPLQKIGDIDFKGGLTVIRDGEQSSITEIEDKDIVYKVSDIWGGNSYLLVSGKKIEGKFKALLPSKVSPKQIQIDNTVYDFSKDMDLSKIKSSSSGFAVDDDVVALAGHDGKIVDVIYSGSDNTSDYAIVLNYSASITNDNYTVKLLLPNNTVASYKVKEDPSSAKGFLVTYEKIDDSTVALTKLSYTDSVDHYIRKDEKMIDNEYVSDDVTIFNIISNNEGSDAQVEILNWSDMLYGSFLPGYIQYIGRAGVFSDVNIIVTNDLFDQKNRLGLVKKIENRGASVAATILVDGKEYVYNSSTVWAYEGEPVKVSLSGNGIDSVLGMAIVDYRGTSIEAIDAKRIKMNGTTYRFRDNISIYKKDASNNITAIGKDDIDTSKTYKDVSVYTDRNNKVKMIFITEA